jgi:hypothetical protein
MTVQAITPARIATPICLVLNLTLRTDSNRFAAMDVSQSYWRDVIDCGSAPRAGINQWVGGQGCLNKF